MSQTIQFPQGPIVDPQTGYVSLEWFEWFQNPQILSLVIGTALDPASGGTGIISYTVGDIIYASAATTLSKLADVATGNALISGGVGVAPSYGKIGLTTHVSGTLPIANGGTNSATALSGQSIMVSDGTKIVQGGAGTTTTVLHGNAAGAPSYGAVSISADVSGLGTNVATFLGAPSSANLAAALTDETGTGAAVFAGQPSFSSTIGVGGATASASGAGISFPATQSASTDANTLDDYEEGTFTPAVTFTTPGDLSVAYTTQVAKYTKTGNVVNYFFRLVTSTFTYTTATGDVRITGLPFTSATISGSWVAPLFMNNLTAATLTMFNVQVISATTSAAIGGFASGVNNTALSTTNFPTTSNPQFSAAGFYHAA